MADREIPTPELLRQLLRYESETGKLYWLNRPRAMFACKQAWSAWNTKYAGKEAGDIVKGYGRIRVRRNTQLASHRAAWAIHHGAWPTGCIDHLNGDPSDNRIENLRDCSNSENHRNCWRQANNTSGVTGVRWEPGRKLWEARIKVNGKNLFLGRYKTIEEAAAARLKANAIHGFSIRHGRSI